MVRIVEHAARKTSASFVRRLFLTKGFRFQIENSAQEMNSHYRLINRAGQGFERPAIPRLVFPLLPPARSPKLEWSPSLPTGSNKLRASATHQAPLGAELRGSMLLSILGISSDKYQYSASNRKLLLANRPHRLVCSCRWIYDLRSSGK